MASNPPFQVEDQTDEDFFDKLIDDDLEPPKPAPAPAPAPKLAEVRDSDDEDKAFSNLGISSDEVKAFANLSIEDAAGEVRKDVKSETTPAQTSAVLSGAHEEESVGFDNGDESNNGGVGLESESVADSGVNPDTGSSGVKEVGWSSFYADMGQDGSGDFESDFFNGMGDNSGKVDESIMNATQNVPGNIECKADDSAVSTDYAQYKGQTYSGQSNDAQDLNNSQYWESLYPGWKYDANTGQWYQVESYDSTVTAQGSYDATTSTSHWVASSDGKSEVSYMQQTAQSVSGTISQSGIVESVSSWQQISEVNSDWSQASQANSSWNQDQQLNNGYPEHMVFDPQYPGWYYDMLAQEWRTLESYTSSLQSTINKQQNNIGSTSTFFQGNNKLYADAEQTNNYGSQSIGYQGQDNGLASSLDNNSLHGMNTWQPEAAVDKSERFPTSTGSQQINNYSLRSTLNNHANIQKPYNSFGAVQSYENNIQSNVEANGAVGFQNVVPGGNTNQPFNISDREQDRGHHRSTDYYSSQNQVKTNQQPFPSAQEFPVVSTMGRSSAGRPPHALVTFGFGGKLIVMKDNSSLCNSSFGSQDVAGNSISILNLVEVAMGSAPVSSAGPGGSNYFHALCQQSFPGPIVGGNVGSKELNRWIDERIANCESMDLDDRRGKVLKLLLSLLKIACQHYGKLRSPLGTDTTLRENDTPEMAVAKLFASIKNVGQLQEYSAPIQCVQNCPSEYQIQATALEVQSLLVSGRKKEALQRAQEGQLWGPALVLATQLGDQFYVDTVKQMALRQLVAGSPLRTLCLLIAGQPAEVFSTGADGNVLSAANFSQQHAQYGANGMLDDWEENLAVIAANRTKDDGLVIVHLGDSLWKERSDITAAHICYLIAEIEFESYSDSARLCLLGADHWKYPRTYACPEAIQRTELYEYSRVIGNPQFIIEHFQPYKLIYAYMLAELGRLSDSLKYCQAVMRCLKTVRQPEVETWKQLVSSLEERIKTHQQGGYTANLAPAKLVGKLLNFFDSTAHKVVGGMPPPAVPSSHGSAPSNDPYTQPSNSRVLTSQSTMAMSSLMPSSSMEPISEWSADDNRKTMYNRSVSEPDFSRNPKQDDSSKSDAQDKASGSGRASRLSRFGFGSQILQKTVGLVLRPRPGKQAKLGEKNKFYYDEKLKRWVEEGADPPAEEAALPPPPTTAAFQNGIADYNSTMMKNETTTTTSIPEFKSPTPVEHTSGIPPMAPSSNQFSVRGRMGVRSRYVDTFNKGGGTPTNLFQPPSLASVKPAAAANPKFFIPAPAAHAEQTDGAEPTVQSSPEDSSPPGGVPTSASMETTQNHTFSPVTNIQRFPSVDNIARNRSFTSVNNGPVSSQARRTASWSGSFVGDSGSSTAPEVKPLGDALGMPSSAFMPSDHSLGTSTRSGSYGDDLHEVEL